MYQTIIIEDDPIVASINRHYVELNKDMEVCGCFSNGRDALNYLEEHSVDLAITALYMPKMMVWSFYVKSGDRRRIWMS